MASNKKPRSEAQKRADAKYEAKRKGTRHHNWNAIGYPESMPPNWRDLLSDQMVQWWASPLHNLDKNPDGTPKKDHHHIDISFHNPVPYERAKEVFDAIGAVMPPKNPAPNTPRPDVLDLKQSLRYFCHMDNPSKAQYKPSDCTWGGGAAPYSEMVASSSDDDELIGEVMDFCDQYGIVSYRRLCTYVRKHRPEWRRVVFRVGSVTLSRYLRSAAWERSNPELSADDLGEEFEDMRETVKIDYQSGEIIRGESKPE